MSSVSKAMKRVINQVLVNILREDAESHTHTVMVS